ncbi:hypothetical protein [Halobaculum sp. D14]|uniref:hypothetical protein n=1 Tax=unclassified Halobaculum TaxID=2640896 RepID=UPI003EB928C5
MVRGSDLFQAVLLAAATAYLLGAAAPAVHDRVPHYERVAAIPLGLLGVVAAAVGVPTDLPVLFILLGAAAVVDLRWDPTGNVHGADD